MRALLLVPLALLSAQPAYAEMAKSEYTAPNGVVVDVLTDDFAGRREYSSPSVAIAGDGNGTGKAFVGEVFDKGKLLGLTIQGLIFYSGDWRFYTSAIFRGGEAADYHRMDGDVSGCSRWGCSMSESFIIKITPEQAHSHADGGGLALQVRSEHGQTALIQVPLAYLDAVAAVAGEPAQEAATPSSAPSPSPPESPAPVIAKPAPKKPTTNKPTVTCITCGGD